MPTEKEARRTYTIACEECRKVLAEDIETAEEVERIRREHGWKPGVEWSLCKSCQAKQPWLYVAKESSLKKFLKFLVLMVAIVIIVATSVWALFRG